MRTNYTKAKLAQGKVVFGGLINEYSPRTVELFGAIGFDFVMIDCEHGHMNVEELENMVRAAEVFGISPIARVPNNDDSTILSFLDRGVQGIIAPHVHAREQAEAVVKSTLYSPEGERGPGGGRSHDYGMGVTREESMGWVNSQTMVIPMVESVEAMNNLDEILKVQGIDVLHVGPGDLTRSMGNAPQAEVRTAIDKMIPRIRAAGKLVGIGANSSTEDGVARILHVINLGANFITIGAQGFIRLGAQNFLKRVQAAQ